MKNTNKNDMFTLDNAAKIYPASMTKKWNSVFRLSAFMKEAVDKDILKTAVCDLAPRFPTYYVQLTNTLLWDCLKKVSNYDIVEKETAVCRPMNVGTDDKPMFRVIYNEKKISVEFFHAVTDGTGAMIYLKTLIGRYLELQGYTIEKANDVLDINDIPSDEETQDAFQRLYQKGLGMSRNESDAYQYKTDKAPDGFQTVSGIIPIDQLKMVSKNKYGCTITEYLVSVYVYSFLQQYISCGDTSEKPIKISVPINLRPYFNASTLRNFASYVNVEVFPKNIKSFDDILSTVKKEMKTMITKENLHKAVSQNVNEEKMLISKYSPIVLKRPVMRICYKLFGERKYTSTLSNLGLVKVPDSLAMHIERFDFILCGGGKNPVSSAAVGFNNKLTLTFTQNTKSTEIPDCFFSALRKDGITLATTLNGKAINVA